MKNILKKTTIHILLAGSVFVGLGFVYAALPEVNPEDNLTAGDWNNVVGAINNFGFDNGNIGIGTSTPSETLEIRKAAGNPTIKLVPEADNAFSYLKLVGKGSGNEYEASIHASYNGSLNFNTLSSYQIKVDGVEAIRINPSRNVGIGTVTPDAGLKLDVEGKVGATEYCDENGANCTLASNLGSGGGGTGGKFVDGTTPTDAVFTGGNIGVGTNNPSNILELITEQSGGSAEGIKIQNSVNGWGGSLTFGVGNDGGYDSARITSTNDNTTTSAGGLLRFLTANESGGLVSRMTINDEGHLGIGTDTPVSLLELSGVESPSITFHDPIGTIQKWEIGEGISKNGGEFAIKELPDSIQGSDIVFDFTGNFGVGTSSPSAKIHILQDENPVSDSAILITEPNNAETIRLHLADNFYGEYGYLDLGGDISLGTHTAIRGNGQKSYFGGNVGIGTASPQSELDIAGDIRLSSGGDSVIISVDSWNEIQKNINKQGLRFYTYNATDGGHYWYGPGLNFRNCEVIQYFQNGETVQNTKVYTILGYVLGNDRTQWSSDPEHGKLTRDFNVTTYPTTSPVYGSWATTKYGPSILERCAID